MCLVKEVIMPFVSMSTRCCWLTVISSVCEPDAGGAGSRGIHQADPTAAVLCLANLQPGGDQSLPSRGAG